MRLKKCGQRLPRIALSATRVSAFDERLSPCALAKEAGQDGPDRVERQREISNTVEYRPTNRRSDLIETGEFL